MAFFKKNKNSEDDKNKKDFYEESRVTKETLGQKLRKLFGGKSLDENSLSELEETLITADIGPKLSIELIEKLKKKNINNIEDGITFLKDELKDILIEKEILLEKGKLNILFVLGVNGVGKTTSIAKLASLYKEQGFKIMLAAADTFRAAATEQLTKWANILSIPIIKQGESADPASVVFDAMDSAIAKEIELLIIDTAGRLHTKQNLMEELKKIEKIIKNKGSFNKINLLVIDGTTGQNALHQAESFSQTVGVDGIILSKYDSTSKGGIIFNIQKKLNIPFFFIGTGEKVNNIEIFNKNDFVEKIFS